MNDYASHVQNSIVFKPMCKKGNMVCLTVQRISAAANIKSGKYKNSPCVASFIFPQLPRIEMNKGTFFVSNFIIYNTPLSWLWLQS